MVDEAEGHRDEQSGGECEGKGLELDAALQFVGEVPIFDGTETFTVTGIADLQPRQEIEVEVAKADGSTFAFTARVRIDTLNELEYFRAGGILHYVLRKLAA